MSATIISLVPGSEVCTAAGYGRVVSVFYDKYDDLQVIVKHYNGAIRNWYADELV